MESGHTNLAAEKAEYRGITSTAKTHFPAGENSCRTLFKGNSKFRCL